MDGGLISQEKALKLAKVHDDTDIEYLQEEIPKTLEQSLEGVYRVEKIVRAMKDFSHSGGEEKTLVNTNTILLTTSTICRNEWKYVAEDLPLVPCFAMEIRQIFLNLIVNGAHAIGELQETGGEGMGTITISTRFADNNLQIRIHDTGGGIPREIQDRVFESFFNYYQGTREGYGTGIGDCPSGGSRKAPGPPFF